ncbi:MAG: LON peptidase substrate-binding domain-containing protein [Pseudomonadota bacterium]
MTIPLFPLRTVLFPEGLLPLRIFEPRYLEMVTHCLKNQTGFGVVLIREGREVGPATTFNLGTEATIVDWFQGSDGLLGLHVSGRRRFEIQSVTISESGLHQGEVRFLPDDAEPVIPDQFAYMGEMLESIISRMPDEVQFQNPQTTSPNWLVARLAEILPIGLEERQECLECDTAAARLAYLEPFFAALRDHPDP